MTPNESPAALLPCPCCGKADLDRWPCAWLDASGENVVRCAWCHCAAPLKAWNRRASTAPAASESLGSVPDPTPPAVASGEPTAEQWKQAIAAWGRDPVAGNIDLETNLNWIERKARELAEQARAGKEGG